MSVSTYQIYIVDYWVPFPCSEYGGLIIVIAKTEEEAIELLTNDRQCTFDYPYHNDKIKDAVKVSQRFSLFGEHESKVVDRFIT